MTFKDKTERRAPDFSQFDHLEEDDQQSTRVFQRKELTEEKVVPGEIRAYFKVLRGPETGLEIEVKETPAFVGRDSLALICIRAQTVSRQHAVLAYHNHRFHLKDLQSTNGTLVNSQKITESPIKDGDIIQFGDVVCQFIVELRNKT
jgi:pSer/pThr/pTyr-binding forkhead associated (FHA) protein